MGQVLSVIGNLFAGGHEPPDPKYFKLSDQSEFYCSDMQSSKSLEAPLLRALTHSSSDTPYVHVVHGLGGTGKSTAVQEVARHADVKRKFTDCIAFIRIGEDAQVSRFMLDLFDILEKILPKKSAEFTRYMNNGQEENAIRHFVTALANTRTLLVFDDVHRESPSVSGFQSSVFSLLTNLIRKVLNVKKCFYVVVTTKDSTIMQISKKFGGLRSEPLATDFAKEILCSHAGVQVADLDGLNDAQKNAFNLVLERCAGLHLALAIAGCKVGHIVNNQHISMEAAWEAYSTDVNKLIHDRVILEGYRYNLQDMINASLKTVRETMRRTLRKDEIDVDKWFSNLSVTQKNQAIPNEILHFLWDAEVDAVNSLIDELANLHLVTYERRGTQAIRIHDIVHDYCEQQAEQRLSDTHKYLLHRLYREIDSQHADRINSEARRWWVNSEKSWNLYLLNNVVRHLVGAGLMDEVLYLLCDFRWTRYRILKTPSKGEIAGLRGDLDVMLKSLNPLHDPEIKTGLTFILEAVTLSGQCLYENPRELEFQLFGRLSSKKSNKLVKRYLFLLEKYAERPWVKLSENVLEQAGGPIKRKMFFEAGLRFVQSTGIASRVVVGGESGFLCHVDCLSGEKIKIDADPPLEGAVTCLDIAKEKRMLFCGVADGTIRYWTLDVEEKFVSPGSISPTDGSHQRAICVAPNEKFVLVGSQNGKVGVIDLESTDSQLQVRYEFKAHDKPVRCIAVGFQEEKVIVATGSEDGCLKLWIKIGNSLNPLNCEVEESREQARVFRGSDNEIRSVCFNKQGDLLAYASDKYLAVIETDSLEVRRDLHLDEDPLALLFSPKGNALHFTLESGKTSVLREDGTMSGLVSAHWKRPWGIAASVDGKFIFSAGMDNRLAVQKVEEALVSPKAVVKPSVWDLMSSSDRNLVAFSWRGESTGLQTLNLEGMQPPHTRGSSWNSRDFSKNFFSTNHQSGEVTSVFFHDGGNLLVFGTTDGNVFFNKSQVSTETSNLTWVQTNYSIADSSASIVSVAISNDGSMFSACSNNMVKIWEVESGTEVRSLDHGAHEKFWKVAFSEESTCLVAIAEDKGTVVEDEKIYGTFHFLDLSGTGDDKATTFGEVSRVRTSPRQYAVMVTEKFVYTRCMSDKFVRTYDRQSGDYEEIPADNHHAIQLKFLRSIEEQDEKRIKSVRGLFMKPFNDKIFHYDGNSEEVFGTLDGRMCPSFRCNQWLYDASTRVLVAGGKMDKMVFGTLTEPVSEPILADANEEEDIGIQLPLTELRGDKQIVDEIDKRKAHEFEVFISFAGEDREMAERLYLALRNKGIIAFLDSEGIETGTDYSDRIMSVVNTVHIAVFLLSPQFTAKKWPMKELIAFLERNSPGSLFNRLTVISGLKKRSIEPYLIPVFYRVTVDEAKSWDLFKKKDETGENVFIENGFMEKSLTWNDAHEAMKKISGRGGIENKEGVPKYSNDESVEIAEKRNRLIRKIVTEVEKKVPGKKKTGSSASGSASKGSSSK